MFLKSEKKQKEIKAQIVKLSTRVNGLHLITPNNSILCKSTDCLDSSIDDKKNYAKSVNENECCASLEQTLSTSNSLHQTKHKENTTLHNTIELKFIKNQENQCVFSTERK